MGKLKIDSPIYCIKDNWENGDNERSSMHKAEYDLNAIMYPAYDTHHILRTITRDLSPSYCGLSTVYIETIWHSCPYSSRLLHKSIRRIVLVSVKYT